MKFPRIYFLHGKGGSPNGTVKFLKHAIVPLTDDGYIMIRPELPHGQRGRNAEESVEFLHHLDIPFESLLIGVSLGGLVAAKLQEEGRPDLTVACISSPTWADGVLLRQLVKNRIALYSATDPVITGRTANWPMLASKAYDLPWLTHDTDRHLDRLAPALAYFLNEGEFCFPSD